MTIDPRTPVLAGVGVVTKHGGDPDGPDATALMLEATELAFTDAGAPRLRERLDAVLVPKGTWRSTDPAREIAAAAGAPGARTVLAQVGILQLSLVAKACEAVRDGAGAVLVVAGEAAYRAQQARRRGLEAPEASGPEQPPDETLAPTSEIITAVEIERHLAVAARQFAIVESAVRHEAGRSVAAHAAHLGELWARFGAVAAANPDAWDRSAPAAERIAHPGPGNRMIAAPYTKLLSSQMNVDQGTALLFTTAAAADEAGVPRDRWVFPGAVCESNLVVPVPARRDIHRWPAAGVAGRRLTELTGVAPVDVEHVDLYSCFPAAVQVVAAELGLPLDRQLTVTGGMTFAGGPLNNYTYLAVVALAQRLREDPSARGLTTSVSGLLGKPAVALWSGEPPAGSFRFADVTDEAVAATPRLPLEAQATGVARIAGYTVLYEGDAPSMAVGALEVDGVRTVAACDDAAVAAALAADDAVGAAARITAPGVFSVDG